MTRLSLSVTQQTLVLIIGFIFGLSLLSSLDWTFQGLEHLPQKPITPPTYNKLAETTKPIRHRCQVTQVFDGDTLECQFPGSKRREHVRLLQIDSPESKHSYKNKTGHDEPGAAAATQRLTELTLNQWVQLEYDVKPDDRYGRSLAFIYRDSDSDIHKTPKAVSPPSSSPSIASINEILLREGLVKVRIIPPNRKYEERFKSVEMTAKQRRLGLWKSS